MYNMKLLIDCLVKKDVELDIKTDSRPAISIAYGDDDKKFRDKYFGTKALRIRQEVKQSNISLSYINTADNTADILTKPLTYKRFKLLTKGWFNN